MMGNISCYRSAQRNVEWGVEEDTVQNVRVSVRVQGLPLDSIKNGKDRTRHNSSPIAILPAGAIDIHMMKLL